MSESPSTVFSDQLRFEVSQKKKIHVNQLRKVGSSRKKKKKETKDTKKCLRTPSYTFPPTHPLQQKPRVTDREPAAPNGEPVHVGDLEARRQVQQDVLPVDHGQLHGLPAGKETCCVTQGKSFIPKTVNKSDQEEETK